jgi:hypothetical protein
MLADHLLYESAHVVTLREAGSRFMGRCAGQGRPAGDAEVDDQAGGEASDEAGGEANG